MGLILRVSLASAMVLGALLVASPAQASTGGQRAMAVRYAISQVGDRYAYGATGPSRWDCSSLVQAAWRKAGKRIPRTTWGQINIGRRVSRWHLLPGDIVFTSPSHVQLYVGRGYVVEAANPSKGVVKRRLYAFWTARRP